MFLISAFAVLPFSAHSFTASLSLMAVVKASMTQSVKAMSPYFLNCFKVSWLAWRAFWTAFKVFSFDARTHLARCSISASELRAGL
jgi:hypothetical protein